MSTATAFETDLMVAFSQILEGDAVCDMCGDTAKVTLSANPDYHDTPMCWMHARAFIDVARDMGERFWA